MEAIPRRGALVFQGAFGEQGDANSLKVAVVSREYEALVARQLQEQQRCVYRALAVRLYRAGRVVFAWVSIGALVKRHLLCMFFLEMACFAVFSSYSLHLAV